MEDQIDISDAPPPVDVANEVYQVAPEFSPMHFAAMPVKSKGVADAATVLYTMADDVLSPLQLPASWYITPDSIPKWEDAEAAQVHASRADRAGAANTRLRSAVHGIEKVQNESFLNACRVSAVETWQAEIRSSIEALTIRIAKLDDRALLRKKTPSEGRTWAGSGDRSFVPSSHSSSSHSSCSHSKSVNCAGAIIDAALEGPKP